MPAELSELLREAERLRRSVHAVPPTAQAPPWFRIEAKADDPKTAEVWIYDRIGSDFFDEGVSAKTFVRQINALKVDEIVLHINSPGGDFFDGAAIYNALQDHPATVTAIIDGLAASAASFIAQAGDSRRMNRATQMMIHDASGVVIGNAGDMADFAEVLDNISDSVAGIYATRSGGSAEDWRTAMRAETWYTASEAVEAGLADEAVDEEPPDPPVRNRFDLAIFNYAGRQAAPPPVMPSVSARTETPAPAVDSTNPPNREGAVGMPDAAKLREALGLKADASDQEVTAALAAGGLGVKASDPPVPNPPADPSPPGRPSAAEPDQTLSPKVTAPAAGSDAVLMDPAHLLQLQAQAARGDEAFRKMREAECDKVISQAIKDGKFPPSREEHYRLRWATDPDGTEDEIKRLAKNTIPVSATGYPGVGDETETDMVYNAMYPGSGSANGSTKAGATRG